MHPFDERLRIALGRLASDPTVVVFADITTNLHGVACAPSHAETIVATRDAATLDALRPDLVLHFGGQVTSKALKQLLRKGTAQALWHVCPALIAPDTYQQLSQVIPMAPTDFFEAPTLGPAVLRISRVEPNRL
jgi:2-succinyl-5-enolpyruvyl-6-hydroxy-3-cyclohexene-1-carboxylate synthase